MFRGENDFELGVGGECQVLGTCVQYCPFEASEQKIGAKKLKLN